MKKTTKLFSILALLLCVVSCQIAGVDNGVVKDNGFKVTAVIDNTDATRLAYAVDGEANTITPSWAVGDKIIGVDDKDQKFTFTVESVSGEVATLNVGTYVPGEAHEVKAFYVPGVEQTAIGIESLNVDLDPQEGVLNGDTPVIMSAVSEIVNGEISLTFTKQTAIVGLKKFKLPKQATITSMELNGVSTGIVFTWDYQGMRVASSNEIGAIHLKGNWETDAEGVCTTPVYFAVAPQTNANISLSMSTGTEQFVNVNTIAKLNIEAGYYYHMTKEMGGPAVTVNGAGFASLEEAFTAASALPGPVTITLERDVTPTGLCNFYNPDNTSTNYLDLNGHNITTKTASLINVKDCNLTLTDGSTDNPAEWGTISATTAAASTNYVVIISGEKGSFNMLKGNVTTSVCRGLNLTAGPTATLTGGKIESVNGIAVGIGSSGGTLYVAGDIKIIGSGNVVYLWGGTATFSGGFVSNGKTSAPIYAADNSTVYFANGYVKTPNINSVAVTGTGVAYVLGGYHSSAVRDIYAKDAEANQYYNDLNTDEATREEYPYHVVPASSNPLVATVLSGSYVWNHSNIQSAGMQTDIRSKNTAATTMKLQSDITSGTTFSFSAEHKYLLTVDLNSHKLTSSALPALQAHCPMVLMDTGGAGEIFTTGAIAVRSSDDLTINGGSYVAATNVGSTAIVATDTCDLVINGGYFYSDDSYDVRRSSENASITISAGRFRKALDASTIADGCAASAEELVYNGRTYGYKVAAAAVVALVNGTGYATMAAAVAAVNSIPADGGRASIILQEDIENVPRFTLNNSNLPLALDLNGHTLSSTDSVLITVENAFVTITDSGLTKGKITTTQQKALLIKAGGEVSIANCTIESTKAKGSSFSEPCVYVNGSGAQLIVNNGTKICTTDSLTCIRVYTGSLTVNGGEITSGINSAGWYCVVSANTATTVINGGSFYTSGRGNASTCHIAASGASVTVNGGYFHSAGRCASAGNSDYGAKMVLKGGYFTGVKSASVAIEEGKAWTELDPKETHLHETLGLTLEYGYAVK